MRNMRRYIVLTLCGVPPVILLPPVIDIFNHDYGVLREVGYLALLVLLLVQRLRLVPRAMDTEPTTRPPVDITIAVVLAIVMALDMAARSQFAGYWISAPALVLGLLASMVGGPLRRALLYGAPLVLTAALQFTADAAGNPTAGPQVVVLALLLGMIFVSTDVSSLWLWNVVQELDKARSTVGALAVTEERLRIAADLHDIQGNHLQAIALKGELAERLIGTDDAKARQQAGEIAELARTALSDTRALVQGYRKTSLDTEIGNAVGILDAAGIEVTVQGRATDVPATLRPLFGALVREATTNLLRHSNASSAELSIVVDQNRVTATMRNDGVDAEARPSPDGSGLAGLRERFAEVGGEVRARAQDGGFELVASAGERR